MDVEVNKEEEKSCKRKVEDTGETEEEKQEREDAALVNFFGEFRVPTLFWGVYKQVEDMGLVYLHHVTNKPLMIIRRVEPNTFKVTGYNVFFQTDEEKADNVVGMFKFYSELMGETEEDKRLFMCHTMEQVAAQYMLEGTIDSPEEAFKYCDEFLATAELSHFVERTAESFKKRRVHK